MTTTAIGSTVNRTFIYDTARVSDLTVETRPVEAKKKGRSMGKVSEVTSVTVKGRKLYPSKRFWNSLHLRFGFAPNTFRWFDHKEVFDRISERAPDDLIRYCIEINDNTGAEQLLAVTNPANSCVKYSTLYGVLEEQKAENVLYTDGVIRSTHTPRTGQNEFKILGDDFVKQFVIDTPIDGYGKPNVYLSLLRTQCQNGAVGYGKAFRSEIATGSKDNDVLFAITRAMEGFNNEDGYAAMRQRFEATGNSWASIAEVTKLSKVLYGAGNRGQLKKTSTEYVVGPNSSMIAIESSLSIFKNFNEMTGDLAKIYGLSNMDSLSYKRQRTLPAACKVYDLLNFASETATHYAEPEGARSLQGYIGDLISTEYDLEGTADQYSDWRDFFIATDNPKQKVEEDTSGLVDMFS